MKAFLSRSDLGFIAIVLLVAAAIAVIAFASVQGVGGTTRLTDGTLVRMHAAGLDPRLEVGPEGAIVGAGRREVYVTEDGVRVDGRLVAEFAAGSDGESREVDVRVRFGSIEIVIDGSVVDIDAAD